MIARDYQRAAVAAAREKTVSHGNTLLVLPTGCHAPETPILMFDGAIRPVETIGLGDQLMGPDNRSRTVCQLHSGRAPMVEVRPIKGEPFVVNESHILALVKTSEGSCGSHASATPGGTLVDISVAELRRRSANFRHLHKLYRVGVDFPAAPEPPLDPYFLGLLLGDGCLVGGGVSITTPDAEIVEVVHHEAARLGLNIRLEQCPDNEANTYHFVTPRGHLHHRLGRRRRTRRHRCDRRRFRHAAGGEGVELLGSQRGGGRALVRACPRSSQHRLLRHGRARRGGRSRLPRCRRHRRDHHRRDAGEGSRRADPPLRCRRGVGPHQLHGADRGLRQPAGRLHRHPAADVAHLRALAASSPVDVVSTDQHIVKPWFNGRIGVAPPVVDLAERGFPLAGGRIDYVGGRRVAVVVYTRRRHVIDVFVLPEEHDTEASGTSHAESLASDGYTLLRRRWAGLTLWLVSDLNPAELGQFADWLTAGW